MKSTSLLLASVAWSLAPTTGAISLREHRRGIEPRVVDMKIQRNTIRNPVANDKRRLARRSGHLEVGIDNLETLYFLNASLGTPEQALRLHLDTGSSDLWVNTPNSTLCKEADDPCSTSGTYNADDSSTYEFVNSDFNISYVDGSGAAGDYATDVFTIGGTKVTTMQFGIGYESTSDQSILGIGYAADEVAAGEDKTYNNLPLKLVADGVIASNAYSLYLDDLEASTGSILFGGVDQEQYTGELVTVPIQKIDGEFAEFFITLTGLSFGNTTLASDASLAVLLDSGSSLTYLPDTVVEDIFNTVDAVYDEEEGAAFVACSLADDDTNVVFNFSSPATITVPISELVLDFMEITGRRVSFGNGEEACMFGIAPAGSSSNVLGDTFLRSAYVVFDLANNEISLAQSKFNATETKIVEIGTGSDAVPSTTDSKAISASSGLPDSTSNDEENAAAGLSAQLSTLMVAAAGLAIGFNVLLG